jgi:hypothetical protein
LIFNQTFIAKDISKDKNVKENIKLNWNFKDAVRIDKDLG